VVYEAAGENGWKAWTCGVPTTVIVFAATCVFVSMNLLLWHVSSVVLVIGVRGVVLGVKAAV
jgi:uncharacterized membrane protein YhiD involved in acid resistance